MPDQMDRNPEDELGPTEEIPRNPSPEEFTPVERRRTPADDDIPFRLPPADEGETVPKRSERGELWDRQRDLNNMPTMPIPREPGSVDPKQTLPGSGGMDPNPDFKPSDDAHDAGRTVAHMPAVPAPPPADLQRTQMHTPAAPPPADHARYQRPQYTVPAPPPHTQAGIAPALPPRAQLRRRTILGCAPGCVMVFAGLFATFCGGLTLLTIIISTVLGTTLERRLSAQVALVDQYQNFESTFFYDRRGVQLYEAFSEGRRTNVRLVDMPADLINATIAIEDDTFYNNIGVDIDSTFRAMLQYFGLMQGSTGGSTITQQLVRNVLFDPAYRAERSIQRKLEEIGLALALTRRQSKDDILQMYLNEIYYGNLAYGAEAAARTFFDKPVSQLTLGEAALLAGLPQAPSELDPLNPDPAIQAAVERRWRTVLDRMVRVGFITDAQRNEALRAGLSFARPDVPFRAPHFVVFARVELERLMAELGFGPEEIGRGGLRVYTTLDLRINDLAQEAARNQINRLRAGNNVTNAAVLVTKPITGEILAMVGSVDYNDDAIDGRVNVTLAPRQPGSTLKPLTYAAAIEQGMSVGEIIWDTPLTITGPGVPPGWPRSYDGRFHGPMRMRDALANSYNIPAVDTLRRIGVSALLEIAQRFGVRSLGNDPGVYGLSLTLGGGEVTLLELTRAYSVLANGGALVPTTAILCILNSADEIIYQYENGCPRGTATDRTVSRAGYGTQVLDPRIAFVLSDILADEGARAPAMGSGGPLFTGNIGAAVKTGTTDNVKDNWTVGYTRNVALGVWVGNSNGDPMINSSGLTGAAPIWNTVMTGIHNQGDLLGSFAVDGALLGSRLDVPGGLSRINLCNVRTMNDPVQDCFNRISEWMLESPAALADGQGNLNYPPAPPPQPQQVTTGGPDLQEVEPDIFRVVAHRLPPEVAAMITFNVAPGAQQPPPPRYCLVPIELEPMAMSMGASPLLFIAPPASLEEAIAAERYASDNNLAILPSIACSPELLAMGGGGGYGPPVVTAIITSPAPGAVLTGETPIMGTVQFTPEQALFYKIEVIGGAIGDWTTIGSTHTNSVVNGQLENLYVPGLIPGNYRMRLVIVDHGGGFLQAPFEVPFSVAG